MGSSEPSENQVISGARVTAVFGASVGVPREDGWTLMHARGFEERGWVFRFSREGAACSLQLGGEQTEEVESVGRWKAVVACTGVGAKPFWKKLSRQLAAADRVGDGLSEGYGPMDSALCAALDEEDLSVFLEDSLGRECKVVHGDPQRLGELAWEPRLFSWETVNAQHSGPVVVSSTSHEEPPQEKGIRGREAREYWNNGWVVTHLQVERDLPIVARWCRGLERDLGLLQARCGVFSAQPGLGVIKHWDSTDLLCIQLRGEKTWHVAPNDQVVHPMANVLPPRRSRELETYAGEVTFSREMPTDARSIVMKPGSVLYLPGGWWHTTEDGENGLSLSFALRRERKVERAIRLMKDALIQHGDWRAPVSPLGRETTQEILGEALDWLGKTDE